MATIDDMLVVGSSLAATALMIYGGLIARGKRRRVKALLGVPLQGLVEGFPGESKEWTVRLPQDVAPKGYAGEWSCRSLGCGGWGCAYACTRCGGGEGDDSIQGA